MRTKAMRRTLRAYLGSRSARRANTKVKDGSRQWGKAGVYRRRAVKPSARVSLLEQYLVMPT